MDRVDWGRNKFATGGSLSLGIRLAISIFALSTSPVIGQEVQRVAIAGETKFVSTDHADPHVAHIGRLDGALFVGRSRVAFVDGVAQNLGFVDAVTGASWTAREDGVDTDYGPPLMLLDRARGYVATERSGSITVFDAEGDVIERVTYDPFALSFSSPAKVIGMFPDRKLLFRRPEDAPSGFSLAAVLAQPEGQRRDTVRYETPTLGRSATLVARALGDEEVFLSTHVDGVSSLGAEPILFGHRLLESRVGEHLVIVQTDREKILVYNRSGMQIADFPMPGERQQVTEEQTRGQRVVRMKRKERENEIKRKAKERSYAENFGAVYSPRRDSVRIDRLPSKTLAPPVDRVLGDLDGRVWLRIFAMPSDTMVHWRVWKIGHDSPDFEVELPRSTPLLDASGDLLLLENAGELASNGFTIRQIRFLR